MKSLFAGIVLIIVIGLAGFIYRNVAENAHPGGETACSLDAKICPDGSSVGRTGPSCAFAPCPPPNVELPFINVAFVLPAGYVRPDNAQGTDESDPVTFVKATSSSLPPPTIEVRRYPIPEGHTADEVILAHTVYYPADMPAEDFSRFDTLRSNGKEFRMTTIERFEALVHSAYFLARADDVLRFDVVEHNVTDWMDPDLVLETLPEHAALLSLLGTLQTAQ